MTAKCSELLGQRSAKFCLFVFYSLGKDEVAVPIPLPLSSVSPTFALKEQQLLFLLPLESLWAPPRLAVYLA